MEIKGKEYILIPKGYDPEALVLTGMTAPVQTEAEIEAVAAGYDSAGFEAGSSIWAMIEDEPDGVGTSNVQDAYDAYNAAASSFNDNLGDDGPDWQYLIAKGAESIQNKIRNFEIGVFLVTAVTEADKDKIADIVSIEGIEDVFILTDTITEDLKEATATYENLTDTAN